MADFAFILAAYFIGSLSFAVIVSYAFGLPDPHSYGSGNPGATNVLRSGKRFAAALTLVGDAAKGWLPVYLARLVAPQFTLGSAAIAAVALAVFAGHLWPVFFRFRGGKGVATAAGILLAVNVWLGAGVLACWLVTLAIFRISSLAALVAAVFAPLCYAWLVGVDAIAASVLAISVLLVWRHRANIRRLLSGEEARVGKAGNTRNV